MTATLIVGVLLACGRWAGANQQALDLALANPKFLPAEWALAIEAGVLALMIGAAARARRLRGLLASRETLTWLGGICLLTAGFFRYNYVIWGAGMSMYGTLTSYLANPSISSLPVLLFAWAMVYGAIALATSFLAIMNWTRSSLRWQWIVLGVFLGSVTADELALSFSYPAWGPHSSWLRMFVVPFSVLAALVATLGFVRNPKRKISWMNLIAAFSILPAAFPGLTINGVPVPLSELLPSMGPGYVLLVLGDLLVLVGSIALLLSKKQDCVSLASAGGLVP